MHHDAHQRPIGPPRKGRTSLLSTSCFAFIFLRRRPAGRPFLSLSLRALCIGSASGSYSLQQPQPRRIISALLAYTDTTLVFIGGVIMWPAATECVHGGGEPLLRGCPGMIPGLFLYRPRSLGHRINCRRRVWQPFSRHSFCSSQTLHFFPPL